MNSRKLRPALACVTWLTAVSPALASNFTIIHSFAAGEAGIDPSGPLVVAPDHSIYGVTLQGALGFGAVFSLQQSGAIWQAATLHEFPSQAPNPGLVRGEGGKLFGSKSGFGGGEGQIWQLAPPSATRPAWAFTTLFTFPRALGPPGRAPLGTLLLDSKADIFGTASSGGVAPCYCGLVYELKHTGPGPRPETVLHSFQYGRVADGAFPVTGLTSTQDGTLFGTTSAGGTGQCLDGSNVAVIGCGTVFRLTHVGGGWREDTIYDFRSGEGNAPGDRLVAGPGGRLFGMAELDIFCLSPPDTPGAAWTKQVVATFPGGVTGTAPTGAMVLDGQGNLYGTTRSFGIDGPATLFRLSPPPAPFGRWTVTILHRFPTANLVEQPQGGLTRASDGTLFGAIGAGNGQGGYIFAYTP